MRMVWAGLRGPLRLDDVLLAAKKANRVAPLQVLRADRIVGEAHLQSAADHAERAMAEGRAHADRPEVEFTRYVAGVRQIQKAIAKMGVPDGCEEAVAVAFGDKASDALQLFIHSLAPIEDDSVLQATPERVVAFGIALEQLEATHPDRHLDLVLEAVAEVDTLK